MKDPWFALGLDNSVIQVGEKDLTFIRMECNQIAVVRKLLGYFGDVMSPIQRPVVVEQITLEEGGIRIDHQGRCFWIDWRDCMLHGSLKMNDFLKAAFEQLRIQNEHSRPIFVWAEIDGFHTTDKKVFEKPADAILHSCDLIGKVLSVEDKMTLIDNIDVIRKEMIGDASKEAFFDESQFPSSEGQRGLEKKDKEVLEMAKKLARESPDCPKSPEKSGAPAALVPEEKKAKAKKGKCPGCGGQGYMLVGSFRERITINAVERCDTCARYKNDEAALRAAVRVDFKAVMVHLGIPSLLECKEMPLFNNRQFSGDCELSIEDCNKCYAKFIQKWFDNMVEELEAAADAEGIATMVHGDAPSEHPVTNLQKATDKQTLDPHHLLGYACAGCMMFWVKDDGDPDPSSKARKTLEAHDDEVHGGCRPTWVPIFPRMIDDKWNILPGDHYSSKPITGVEEKLLEEQQQGKERVVDDMIIEHVALTEEGVRAAFRISPEAMEQLKVAAKDGKVWLPQRPEESKFPCGESRCKTTKNSAFGCNDCPENKIGNAAINMKIKDNFTNNKTSKFWTCHCKDDFIKPKAMKKCIRCKSLEIARRDSMITELNEFQAIIAKGTPQTVNFAEWSPDDIEIFIFEVAVGLSPPFENVTLMSELSKYGMELDLAMKLVDNAWRTEGTIYGPDSSKLRVTMADQENYVHLGQEAVTSDQPKEKDGQPEVASDQKPETYWWDCPDCGKTYADKDGNTAGKDEAECFEEFNRCRACQKKAAMKPEPVDQTVPVCNKRGTYGACLNQPTAELRRTLQCADLVKGKKCPNDSAEAKAEKAAKKPRAPKVPIVEKKYPKWKKTNTGNEK